MPTTVTKSIGSAGGRDYSTLALWIAGCPADLTSADQIWSGECYNDSEFYSSSGGLLTITGITSDATRYINLTAAAGQSFQDNVNVRTNALKYNQSNGVGLKCDTSYASSPITNADIFHISRLQVSCNTRGAPYAGSPGQINAKDCLFITIGRGNILAGCGSSSTFYNVVAISQTTEAPNYGAVAGFYGTDLITGCVILRTSDKVSSGKAINFAGTTIVKSTAIFGFSTAPTIDSSSQNNATDLASLTGSNNKTSVTYNATTPFTQADSTSGLDFKAIAATDLAANGFLDSTNAPNDISATARADPPTIGSWELVSAGGSNIKAVSGDPLATIKAVSGVAKASIKKIAGVAQ